MSQAETLPNLVLGNAILRVLTPAEVDYLVTASTVRSYEKNRQIFHRGDPGDGLYLIVSGQIGIKTLFQDGNEIFLNVLDKGDIFGEIAAIDGGERTAGAVAMEAVQLLFVERRVVHELLGRNNRLCVRLLELVCERLRWTSGVIEDSLNRAIRSRLASRLLKLAGEHGATRQDGTVIQLKLTQEMLARMLGATRESVNKELMGFQRAGLITRSRGYVTIRDAGGLSRASQEDDL